MNSLFLITLYWPSVYLGVSIVLGLIAASVVALTCKKKSMLRRKIVLAFLTPATAIAAAFLSIFISGMAVGYWLHSDDREKSLVKTELAKGYELRTPDTNQQAGDIYSKDKDSVSIAHVDSVMVIGDTIVGKSEQGYFVLRPDQDKPEYYPSMKEWAYYTKDKMTRLVSPHEFYWQKREIAFYVAGIFCALCTFLSVYLLWVFGLSFHRGYWWKGRYPCPCCGHLTYNHKPSGIYEICEVCYWEDDPEAYADPTSSKNANGVSLEQAKANFNEYGACRRDMVSHVRKPLKNEIPVKRES